MVEYSGLEGVKIVCKNFLSHMTDGTRTCRIRSWPIRLLPYRKLFSRDDPKSSPKVLYKSSDNTFVTALDVKVKKSSTVFMLDSR